MKISVVFDNQHTVCVTPFDSHLLCAATGVQTLFINYLSALHCPNLAEHF